METEMKMYNGMKKRWQPKEEIDRQRERKNKKNTHTTNHPTMANIKK